MNDMDQFVVKLRGEFLDEAAFLLEQCEETLLTLETTDEKAEVLAEIFRSAHTIKGSGAAVGFDDLVRFAHVFESCLAVLRGAPELVSADLVSLLLRGVDALKARVSAHRAGQPGPWDVDQLKQEIDVATQKLTAAEAKTPTAAAAAAVTPAAVDRAAAFGFFDNVDLHGSPLTVVPPLSQDQGAPQASVGASKGAASASIKVDAQRIDGVLDMVGELVVVKSQLLNRLGGYPGDLGLQAVGALLDTIVRDLQDRALSIRLTPLKPLFLKLQRIVRDLALRFGKKVELSLHGEETEIDRTTVEMLADPLMHMVRNAIDHGIESVDRRLAAGKPEAGLIAMKARQVGGRVVIEITDDGGGIPRDKVLNKALERGMLSPAQAAAMTDKEVFALIFAPGFSTAAVLSDVSGRGVGMDVVKTNIERLKGTIDITSTVGKGSTFTISLPLTTSITDGILVKVRGQPYVIPMDVVRDLVDSKSVHAQRGSTHEGLVSVRGKVLPLIKMDAVLSQYREEDKELRRQILQRHPQARPPESALPAVPSQDQRPEADAGMLVVAEAHGRTVALAVDAVVGQMQVVQKPLSTMLHGSGGVSGAAIMGDGHVTLILDIHAIVAAAQERGRQPTSVPGSALGDL